MKNETQFKYYPVLTGDIGGTNSRLEVILLSKDFTTPYKPVLQLKLDSKKFNSLTNLLKEFLKDLVGSENYPIIGVLGIPGPVMDNKCNILANLEHWEEINGDETGKSLNLKQLTLLNDFVCNGYGIMSNVKEGTDYERLNNNKVHENSPIAMIGAGTGLGYGYLVKNNHSKYYEVYPSEGGHQDFAPQNDTEWEYFKYLQKYYNVQHVSVERACSGPALKTMFQFFSEREQLSSPLLAEKKELDKITNEDILDAGLAKSCPISVKVLELFITIYAAAAGNHSLITLPYGGLYLLGGLTVKLESYIIKENLFREYFSKKGRLEPKMKEIPLFVVKNGHIGVKGSREYARRVIETYSE